MLTFVCLRSSSLRQTAEAQSSQQRPVALQQTLARQDPMQLRSQHLHQVCLGGASFAHVLAQEALFGLSCRHFVHLTELATFLQGPEAIMAES